MGFRFLTLVKPVMFLLPEVEQPDRKVPFKEKFLWTAIALFVFLTCSQIPLYGLAFQNMGGDSLYFLRVLMSSNRGSLMELGIGPIVTSGMFINLLSGSKIIEVDQNLKEDRVMYNATQKLFALLLTFSQALTYVIGGTYGSISELGLASAFLIIIQLFFGGVIVLLLDEMLQKGYGLGAAVSIFIATNICETIAWKTFSPTTINTGAGTEFEGAAVATFHLLISKPDKLYAIKEALYRQSAPNLMNVLATLLVFFIVIYFQRFQIDLPIKYQKVRGQQGAYAIKLFYTSTIPIIVQTSLISNLYFFSQLLYRRFRSNMLVNLIGQWADNAELGGESVPVGGIAYYISPPRQMSDFWLDPIHVLVYIFFVLGSCAGLSKLWIEISGSSPRDVATQLKNQQIQFAGYRDTSLIMVLNTHIPTAATLGGVCIGTLTVIADFLGAIGSGTGILLAVTIVYGLVETVQKEIAQGNAIFG